MDVMTASVFETTWFWVVLIVAVLLAVQFARPSLHRRSMRAMERNLLKMERELGQEHPDVKALRMKVWRFRLYGDASFRGDL